MKVHRHIVISGRVQGIGYRAWTEITALERGIEGWVRNRGDGSVEALFSGPEDEVAAMIAECRHGFGQRDDAHASSVHDAVGNLRVDAARHWRSAGRHHHARRP